MTTGSNNKLTHIICFGDTKGQNLNRSQSWFMSYNLACRLSPAREGGFSNGLLSAAKQALRANYLVNSSANEINPDAAFSSSSPVRNIRTQIVSHWVNTAEASSVQKQRSTISSPAAKRATLQSKHPRHTERFRASAYSQPWKHQGKLEKVKLFNILECYVEPWRQKDHWWSCL